MPSTISATAPEPDRRAQCSSPHMIFCTESDSRDGISSGRIPICIEYSATRAARFAARTATNVASARTSVPSAVASEATVDQSHVLDATPTCGDDRIRTCEGR